MNKLKTFGLAVCAALASGLCLAQESGTAIVDTTDLAAKVTQVQTDLVTFLKTSIAPFVIGIAAAGLLVYLGMRLFRWAKSAISK